MSSGYLSGATPKDLDLIFAPYVTGISPTATGFTVKGVDINTRYAPLVYGTSAPVTGFIAKQGVDLNQLFAAYGTTQYILPINGVKYSAICEIPAKGSGESSCSFGFTSTTQYRIQTYTTYGPTIPTITNYYFNVPANMTQVQVTITVVGGPYGGVTVSNNATTLTTISTNVAATVTLGPFGDTSGTHTAQYSVQVEFADASGNVVWTGTCTFYDETDGSV